MQTSKMRPRTIRSEASSSVIYLLAGLLEASLRSRSLPPDRTYRVRANEKVTAIGRQPIPTFSVARSVVKPQPGQQVGCKPPLPGEHSEAALVLLFQWF